MVKGATKCMKDLYLNCGERCEEMIDHRTYTLDFSSCEIKDKLKKISCNIFIVLFLL